MAMVLWTRDDRGRRVRLHWRSLASPGVPAPTGMGQKGASGLLGWASRGAVWGSARRVASLFLALPLLLAALAVTVVVLAVLAAVNMGPVVIALILFSPVAATGIMFIATSIATTSDWFGRRTVALQARMIAQGRCPSCTYGILGVEPQGDGCVVCPECASAWMVGAARYAPARRVVVTMPRIATPADGGSADPGDSGA